MKVKSPSDCGMSKEHGYLGHFAKPGNLEKGHNSDGPVRGYDRKSIFEQTPVSYGKSESLGTLRPGEGPYEEGKALQEKAKEDLEKSRVSRTRMIQGSDKTKGGSY